MKKITTKDAANLGLICFGVGLLMGWCVGLYFSKNIHDQTDAVAMKKEADALIEKCEEQLPRDRNCVINISASVDI